MKILWTHNFNPAEPNAGVFSYAAAAALRDHGVDVHMHYLGNLRSLTRIMAAAREVRAKARDFDLVHAQFGSAAALATAAAADIPRVVTLRGNDWTPVYATAWKWQLHAKVAVTMTRAVLPRYDLVVCVSERMADEVRAARPSARTLVLPSPIDLQAFHPLDRQAALAATGLAEDGSTYVLFTSLDAQAVHKRPDLARAAVEYARREVPSVSLLVASGVPHSQMPGRVALADAILCTSVSEGWPNSVKEALACNVPFVATDVSDLGAIADADPSCAVVEPTAEALGEALIRVLRQPRPTDLRRHVEDMSQDRITARTIAAYRDLLHAAR